MSVLEAVETAYDSNARPVTAKLVAGGSVQALTQTSYDALGRPECAATRMNPAAFGALPSSACSPGAQGSHGPDRIARNVYDAAGQVTQVKSAVGTALEAADVVTTYTLNGKPATVADGENNKTSYEYDGHDRLAKTYYPSPAKGAGTSNGADYEQLSYDPGGNLTSRRLRDGQTIGMTYDALSRLTYKDLPGSEPDVSHAYDLLGRPTSVSQSGHSLGFTYDALGRPLTQSGPQGAVTSTFDVAGRRTRITHSDGFWAITRTSSPERCTRCANIAPRAASPGRWGNMPIVPAPRLATVAPNSGKALRRMKFSYSAVWNDTAALLRSHFSTALALAGAFIFLPALLVGHFLQQPLPGEDLNAYLAEFQEYLVSNAPWLLLQALVNALGTIAILMLVFAPRGTRVGAVLGAALALLPFYFVAGLIANLIVFAGVLLFIVPGLYLFGRLVPLGPAVAAENRRNPLKALGRAIELTRGHGWAVLGLVLLVGIPGLILMQVVNLLFGILFRILAGDEVATLLQLIVTSATAAALTIVLLLLYAGVYRALSARDQGRPPTEGT